MTDAARRRAERCFALARSTTFPGERDNAIAQGTRIAEAAGLSLDLFDIPGRHAGAAAPEAFDLFESRDATESFLRAFEEALRSARWGQAHYASARTASYAAFHEYGARHEETAAIRREREKRATAERNRRVDRAASFLWTDRKVRAYPEGADREFWMINGERRRADFLVELAVQCGFDG